MTENEELNRIAVALREATEEIARMMPGFVRAAQQAGQALGRMAATLRAAFPAVRVERPVDRARRLYVARAMRARVRRAARHGRMLA